MNAEFTGERVIPGHVDPDLWNEHFCRYAFVSPTALNCRVLDAGCGTGYGSAELALRARSVTGIDLSGEALHFASSHYAADNLRWTRASCTSLPFADGSFDIVTAFEVIEHLQNWPQLIAEARRVLTEDGRFIVSTPNKTFYAESRGESGPNPFHEHEFEFGEFECALKKSFPQVSMYLQDHSEGLLIRPATGTGAAAIRLEESAPPVQHSSFFIAVCSAKFIATEPAFVFMPATANALRDKIRHIERLQTELVTKDAWLAQEQAAHQALLGEHRAQTAELHKSNQWAGTLNTKLDAAGLRIAALQGELADQQKAAREMAAGYEAQSAEVQAALTERTQFAEETERRLTTELTARTDELRHQVSELGRCVELLHQTEALLEERTRWAQGLDAERERLEALLAGVEASRWIRIGRVVGLGPELSKT
ncbi:MAG: methyltransferase domain-containing protein [Bryobacteraceae bacterium]|nr:methyltransferase domain-containing protein [Bryobacteraceae bacterium]